MTDFNAVTRELLSRSRGARTANSGNREVSRLPSGSFRLDYGDEDHVFVLTLQQVPRRRLGPDTPVRVGRIDDLEVDLNAVIVDTGIHVDLSIRDSPRRDALLLEFQADFDSWAALRDRDAEPPRNPGERLLTVTISITDDVGTTYTSHQARAGGTGTEWQARRSFLPAPPSRARQLAVALHTPGGNEVIAQFGM